MPNLKNESEIVAFDFDGTLTKKDSFLLFILFTQNKIKILFGVIYLFPILTLYKLSIVTNHWAKEKVFKFFFKGLKIEVFNLFCERFEAVIDRHINPFTFNKLKQNHDCRILIVTASVENWVLPWAKKNGVDHVIGTKIEISKEGNVTGNFISPNCHGIEKVVRIKDHFNNLNPLLKCAFGNDKGDHAMLRLAEEAFIVKRDKLIPFR